MFKKAFAVLAVILFFPIPSQADQFTLFDKVFTFEEKDAIPTKSHLVVEAHELNKATPVNWLSPHNYADGTVHIFFEVLEKPTGNVKTHWSLCYIANKGQNGSSYACAGSPQYTTTGVYKIERDMKKLWQKDKVDWSQGLKKFTLVIKGPRINNGPIGKSHAHLQPDLKKFFPTKVRVRVVQVAKGKKFNPTLLKTN